MTGWCQCSPSRQRLFLKKLRSSPTLVFFHVEIDICFKRCTMSTSQNYLHKHACHHIFVCFNRFPQVYQDSFSIVKLLVQYQSLSHTHTHTLACLVFGLVLKFGVKLVCAILCALISRFVSETKRAYCCAFEVPDDSQSPPRQIVLPVCLNPILFVQLQPLRQKIPSGYI